MASAGSALSNCALSTAGSTQQADRPNALFFKCAVKDEKRTQSGRMLGSYNMCEYPELRGRAFETTFSSAAEIEASASTAVSLNVKQHMVASFFTNRMSRTTRYVLAINQVAVATISKSCDNEMQ